MTITTNWLDYGGGIIAPTTHPTIGAHAVTVVGADAGRRTLRLFNAKWAPAWGDGGYGVMSFDYFDQHLVEAYTSAQHLVELPRGNRQVLLSPLITRDSSHEVLVFRRPDGDTERCAWAMLTHTAAVTEVDDLYVRPEYRRHGLGQWLWQQLIDLSRLQGRSLRLWVPFADCDPEHLELLRHFFGKRGYALHPSSRPSAGCEVRPGPMPAVVPAVVIPERPALDRTSAVEAAIKLGMAVGPNGPPGWRELNTERAALIRKRRQVGLDPAEQARFDRLQALAHRIVDANLPPPLSDAERAYLTARDPLRQTL